MSVLSNQLFAKIADCCGQAGRGALLSSWVIRVSLGSRVAERWDGGFRSDSDGEHEYFGRQLFAGFAPLSRTFSG